MDWKVDNDSMNGLIAANRKWVEEQRQLLCEREAEIKRLMAECEDIRSKLQPMEEWLKRYCKEQPEADVHHTSVLDFVKEDNEIKGDRLRDEVVHLLEVAYPDSLYYRVILKRLEESGYRIGGRNPGLNLIAHITKEPRIERGEKRGMYRLAVKKKNGNEQDK